MNVAIAFDSSALSFFTIIILLFINKRIAPTQTNRAFVLFVVTLFFASIFSLLTYTQKIYGIPSFLPKKILPLINHLFQLAIPLLFSHYIFTLHASQKKMAPKFLTRFFIPVLIYGFVVALLFILNLNSLVLKLCFTIFTLYFYFHNIRLLRKNRYLFPKQKIVVLISFLTAFVIILNLKSYLLFFPIDNILYSFIIFVLLFTTHRQEETICNISLLYNQTAFHDMYKHYFEKRIPFVIIAIVLDDLLYLLKTLGVQQTNAIIKKTAFFLNQISKDALLFHFNDGKFCATFNDGNENDYFDFVDTVKSKFAKAWRIDLMDIKVFPRLAFISCPQDAKSVEDVIEILEILQHDEKHKKEGLLYASEIDTSYRLKNAYLDRTVKNALSENRIDVYYQPIFSVEQNRIIGAEALVRMKDENGLFVSPEDFIPVAEKNGTILRIGEFVYESVCRFINEINTEHYGIEKMDVNLSVVQCMQENLSEQFLMIADLYKIPYDCLNFEITETAAIFSRKILEQNLQDFSEAGIELALDDYGSGYSNINYLINLPFNMIKIDKDIIWKAFLNDKSYVALSFTISMIKALGMTVLAEGVETYEQVQQLTKLGCDYLQGYYFSKPVPKELFLSLLVQHQTENQIQQTIVTSGAKEKTEKLVHSSLKKLQSINKQEIKGTGFLSDLDMPTVSELIELEELEILEEL